VSAEDLRPRLVRASTVTIGRAACVLVVAVVAELVVRRLGTSRADTWVWLTASMVLAAVVVAVRVPLDRLADRVAYGVSGDPYSRLSGLVERLSDTLAVDDVLPRVAQTVTQATHSDRSDVRLWLGDGVEVREVWPPASDLSAGDVLDVPLRHHGDQVGTLGVISERAAMTPGSRDLLERLAGTAGLALSNVRLTYDLRRRIAESRELAGHLERSHARLLAADREQTEHFSAVVAQRVQQPLRAVEPALDRAWGGEAAALQVAARTVADALDRLRDIAAGVYPPTLAENGLRVALETWALRHDGLVVVTSSGEERRHAAGTEAAAYVCAVDLAEAGLGAGEPVRIEITHDEGSFRVAVAAGRPPSAGTLLLVGDRVEATGGRIEGPATVLTGSRVVVSWAVVSWTEAGRG
jgi:hypothetical protein